MENTAKHHGGFKGLSKEDFIDISDEQTREYIFFKGGTLKLEGKPQGIMVKQKPDGDTHRVTTDSGWSYYINPAQGWAIRWKGDYKF